MKITNQEFFFFLTLKIDHNFILDSLTFLGFGPSVLQWIKVFYHDIQGCIINNGYLSESFKIERGVRQGCPLSAYLLILSIEILPIAVRDNKDITGIIMNGTKFKETLFADDATFLQMEMRKH